MDDRESPHRERIREERLENANGVQRAHVGIGRERAPSRDLGDPDWKPTARVGVVDRLLDRQHVPEQVTPREVSADEKRIGVDADHEQDEKSGGKGSPEPGRDRQSRQARSGVRMGLPGDRFLLIAV